MTYNGSFHFFKNKYSGTIQENWQKFQFEKNYCDVTLACDDKQIEAHKVVISSCSPLFKSMLKDTSDKRPLIHITGIKYKHLENLVNFMYKGEVTVAQEDLGNFLSVVKDLQVKGLSGEIGKSFNITCQSPLKAINSNRTYSPKIPQWLQHANQYDDMEDEVENYIEVLENTEDEDNVSTLKLVKRLEEAEALLLTTENNETIEKEILLIEEENNEPKISFPEEQTYMDTQKVLIVNNIYSKIDDWEKSCMNKNIGNRPYICSWCPKSFISRSSLKSHEREHLAIETQQFKCDQCPNRIFSHVSNLRSHVRTHTKEKPFNCEECSKTFSHNHTLQIHKRVHKGIKPFSCEYCDNKFSDQTNLKRHTRTHTGEKPYHCDKCGKSFRQRTPFTTHLKTHNNGKE